MSRLPREIEKPLSFTIFVNFAQLVKQLSRILDANLLHSCNFAYVKNSAMSTGFSLTKTTCFANNYKRIVYE